MNPGETDDEPESAGYATVYGPHEADHPIEAEGAVKTVQVKAYAAGTVEGMGAVVVVTTNFEGGRAVEMMMDKVAAVALAKRILRKSRGV